MDTFLEHWGEAANTSAGFFWMAFWVGICLSFFVVEPSSSCWMDLEARLGDSRALAFSSCLMGFQRIILLRSWGSEAAPRT